MAGTWTHEDLYMTARSRNEWFHSQLVSRHGGNLNYGAIQFRKNATFSIAADISVAGTNMKILQPWQEDLTRKSTAPMHGRCPPQDRPGFRHQRGTHEVHETQLEIEQSHPSNWSTPRVGMFQFCVPDSNYPGVNRAQKKRLRSVGSAAEKVTE